LRGCAEAYVSGVGLLAGFEEHLADYPHSLLAQKPTVTVNDILDTALLGDPLAARLIDEAVDKLAAVMACCVGVIDPGLFVIGGGLGLALYDHIQSRLEKAVRARTLPVTRDHFRMTRSQVTSSAVGAAALVWQK
jgi:glucokinase